LKRRLLVLAQESTTDTDSSGENDEVIICVEVPCK